MSKVYIVVDFDGTVVEHKFPGVGEPVPGAIDTLKRFQDKGYLIILNTMRSYKNNKPPTFPGENVVIDALTPAVSFFKDYGINLYGINNNPDQNSWTNSPKVYGHFYIDDTAAGCPLIYPEDGRPYVNWIEIEKDIEIKISRDWVKSH